MGFTYSFVDNAVYGPEDINDITRSLTGAGVAPFVSKDSYNVSDLNVMTSALVETGVELDGCKCSIENAGTERMTVTVAQGIVFFESGVRMAVDEEGYVFYIIPNVAGWVYVYYNPALQKADIEFSSELPTDGEYVILAEIAADGSIIDRRTFARSKIATIGRNITVKKNFSVITPELFGNEGTYGYWYVTAEIQDIDISKFNYAIVEGTGTTNLYNLTTKSGVIGVHPGWSSPSTGGSYMADNCYVRVIDGRLCIVVRSTVNTFIPSFGEATFTAEFI